jgi:hypothetical protein
MKRTVSRLFDSHDEAVRAVEDLEAAGFAHDDIALMSNAGERLAEDRSFAPGEKPHDAQHVDNIHASHGVTKGARAGAGIGGAAALLAGAGLLAIPGMGPVLAAGFLATAATGAATGAMTGGMLGALRDSGHSDADAHTLAEGVRRGGAIVSVRAPEERAALVDEILIRNGGALAADRRRDYEAAGWTGFEDKAPRYDPDL